VVRQPSERGAAAVEFALIFPILVVLVLGIVEFGRAYNVQTTLSGAARQGARVMALQNNSTAAKTAVKAAATGLTITDTQISITPTACPTTTTDPTATTTVTIRYPLTFFSKLFGSSITLTGTGVMRCNG
jgi:Flp pilus assembly protein TadG